MTERLLQHERYIDSLLSLGENAEAFRWLDEASDYADRTLGEDLDNPESVTIVERGYRAGASEIVAVDIHSDANGCQNTGRLVVILPESPIQRQSVFAWANELAAMRGWDPEVDFGQARLFVWLDK